MSRRFVGHYQLYKRIYRSGIYSVYRGRHVDLNREAMIKVIPYARGEVSEDWEDARARFFQEAQAAGRLIHNNIVPVTDAGEDEKCLYIIMDYVPGDRLDSYTDPDHLLPVGTVLTIAAQIASALDYAHRRSIVHRDVKPENIIFNDKTNRAFLGDFGVARIIDKSNTRTGTVLGSPSYMSPEQVQGRKLDYRTDIYSLGVSVFQLLTGWLPFVGSSLPDLMMQIVNREPKAIKELRSDLPEYVRDFIRVSMQKDPSKRYKDAKAMAEAARFCLDHLKKERASRQLGT